MLPNVYRAKYGERHALPRKSSGKSMTVPGLALSATQLNERIVNGTAQVREKQPIYEPFYDIDNPNPLRQPNIDLVDVANHSDYLSQYYEQLKNHYDEQVKQAIEKQKQLDAQSQSQDVNPV